MGQLMLQRQYIFMIAVQLTGYALASTINVPADASLVVLGDNSILYLEEGDQIEAGSSGSNDLDIVISYEELSDA